jgi:hypothetical protein
MDSSRLKLDLGSASVLVDSDETFADSPVAPYSANVFVAEEVLPVSTDVVPVSEEAAAEEVFADSVDVVVDSEMVLADSLVAPDSADVLVSYEVVPFSANVVADSVEEVADSVEEVPDDDEVVHCPRCGTFHAGGVFGLACFQARREARRCGRCGLVHSDYDLTTLILDGIDKFDCELYIPDVEKLQMDGDTIIVPEHVQEKLDEMYYMNKMKLDVNSDQ